MASGTTGRDLTISAGVGQDAGGDLYINAGKGVDEAEDGAIYIGNSNTVGLYLKTEPICGGITIEDTSDFNIYDSNSNLAIAIENGGYIRMPNIKTGATQGDAGAVAGDIWADTSSDNVLKLAV